MLGYDAGEKTSSTGCHCCYFFRAPFLVIISFMDLFTKLNPDQKKAAAFFEGPAMVLSGPGSGKTRVITSRIAFLIKERGVATEKILAVTFTNKAANEMRQRIENLVKTSPKWVGTFHSVCAKILRESGSYIGVSPNFTILDEDDSLRLIKEVMKNLDIDVKNFSPGSVKNLIEGAKNELVGPSEYQGLASGFFQEIVANVYSEYQKSLHKNNCLDFDDLLFQTTLLFQNYPEVLEKYQNRWRFILVDEYQDTNKAQYVFTKLLAQKSKNIFVVGDAAQAIYGWRGADYRNILNFSNDFPKAKVFNLEQNYRSTKNILSAATSVISKNRSHPTLNLWTENQEGIPIILYEAKSELDEADFIIRNIEKILASGQGFEAKSFAILYRTNAQSRVIEEALLRSSVPYVLIGGTKFYARKEVKDMVAYLKLIANPADQVSFKRVVNVPPRGIGQVALRDVKNEKVVNFLELMGKIREKSNGLASTQIIDQVLFQTSYLEFLDDGTIEGASRVENVQELKSVAAQFPNLGDFLENVSLVEREYLPEDSKKVVGEKKDAITLITLHAAKGLEYPIVFITGLEEGLFPHSRSLNDSHELEEERRLCYVGITRAQKQLYLSYATERLYFGKRAGGIPSRFIMDIPEELMIPIRF